MSSDRTAFWTVPSVCCVFHHHLHCQRTLTDQNPVPGVAPLRNLLSSWGFYLHPCPHPPRPGERRSAVDLMSRGRGSAGDHRGDHCYLCSHSGPGLASPLRERGDNSPPLSLHHIITHPVFFSPSSSIAASLFSFAALRDWSSFITPTLTGPFLLSIFYLQRGFLMFCLVWGFGCLFFLTTAIFQIN